MSGYQRHSDVSNVFREFGYGGGTLSVQKRDCQRTCCQFSSWGLKCSLKLDHPSGVFSGDSAQGGFYVPEQFMSDTGGLLPIALCGRTVL